MPLQGAALHARVRPQAPLSEVARPSSGTAHEEGSPQERKGLCAPTLLSKPPKNLLGTERVHARQGNVILFTAVTHSPQVDVVGLQAR